MLGFLANSVALICLLTRPVAISDSEPARDLLPNPLGRLDERLEVDLDVVVPTGIHGGAAALDLAEDLVRELDADIGDLLHVRVSFSVSVAPQPFFGVELW